jgi:flagellin-like hook-associated protein FlgL
MRAVLVFAISDLGQVGIALGSAVTGGLLASGATVWVETRRGKRETAASKERDQREVVTSGRLVMEELMDDLTALRKAKDQGHYWPRPDRELSTATWTELRHLLARYLGTEPWLDVSTAYAAINRTNWVVRDHERQNVSAKALGQPIPVANDDGLDDAIEAVDKAMNALGAVLASLGAGAE